ncbi:MAG: hypothetical protein GKR89_36080 [Candidatus Latescibacteria bacterium]|nr:hypothetical protein [Candidatus Latescibacterota bacterium]
MSPTWSGIFPIVITPFTATGALDETSLRRMVAFCLEAGARGLVGPANASEFSTLSDDERRRWLAIVVEESQGRVPVVASVTSGHYLPAAELARFAEGNGCQGIMAMPPHVLHPDQEGCYRYYQGLNEAVGIPICVQNFGPPLGTPMSGTLLGRMCIELEQVHYIKEETLPEPMQITATLAAAGKACKGVMGGQGGIYLPDEHRRGACGNMPGCHTTDVLVDLWERLEAGDGQGARELFNGLLPLMNYERLYGVAVYKEVLHRRGLIRDTFRRAPGAGLDEHTRAELNPILDRVEGLFRVR